MGRAPDRNALIRATWRAVLVPLVAATVAATGALATGHWAIRLRPEFRPELALSHPCREIVATGACDRLATGPDDVKQ
eukprot:3488981-Alexandrium_andersonii.AAC.1